MYGMMPSAKIVSRLKLPPENRSTKPRIDPRLLLEQPQQRLGVDSRRRDVAADAVDRQHGEGEQHPPPQVRECSRCS